ncbi:MAG TPA: hypothetical protein VGI81_27900 [Tepidisphaeraceae bacterium]
MTRRHFARMLVLPLLLCAVALLIGSDIALRLWHEQPRRETESLLDPEYAVSQTRERGLVAGSQKLALGMAKAQAEQIMGPPYSDSPVFVRDRNQQLEVIQYVVTANCDMRGIYVPQGIDQTYTVIFDQAGRAIGLVPQNLSGATSPP